MWAGLEKNSTRARGSGPDVAAVGKTAVAGVKDRATNHVAAQVVEHTDRRTLQGFVAEHAKPGARVYTDEHGAYQGLPNHETVRHSVGTT